METLGLLTGVPFPDLNIICLHVIACFIFEDCWHYWLHRLLHHPYLYKHVHKIHHQYSAPFGLAASYAHPLEIALLGLGTVGAPIILAFISNKVHMVTIYLWVTLRLLQAVDAHSGYDFPWSMHHWFPFWSGAEWHDKHHERFFGNYSSSFRWWDIMMDTVVGSTCKTVRSK